MKKAWSSEGAGGLAWLFLPMRRAGYGLGAFVADYARNILGDGVHLTLSPTNAAAAGGSCFGTIQKRHFLSLFRVLSLSHDYVLPVLSIGIYATCLSKSSKIGTAVFFEPVRRARGVRSKGFSHGDSAH